MIWIIFLADYRFLTIKSLEQKILSLKLLQQVSDIKGAPPNVNTPFLFTI